jgi:hypothetical protein
LKRPPPVVVVVAGTERIVAELRQTAGMLAA